MRNISAAINSFTGLVIDVSRKTARDYASARSFNFSRSIAGGSRAIINFRWLPWREKCLKGRGGASDRSEMSPTEVR